MGTELELCEVLQINSLFIAKRRTEMMEICAYIDGIPSKKRENFLFQHFVFYVGEKDKNKWQKNWP